jgi:hypothetical protein
LSLHLYILLQQAQVPTVRLIAARKSALIF